MSPGIFFYSPVPKILLVPYEYCVGISGEQNNCNIFEGRGLT